jgi:hypothetical protein
MILDKDDFKLISILSVASTLLYVLAYGLYNEWFAVKEIVFGILVVVASVMALAVILVFIDSIRYRCKFKL